MDALRWRDEQRGLRELVRTERRRSDEWDRRDDVPTAGATTARAPSPLASVVVVCWNAADVLGRCLDHLFAQDYANREIIVVDDGSDDDTLDVARAASQRGDVKLVPRRRNRGCPAARNLGLRHATGDIVAFVDADGFADPRWLSRIVEAFGDDRTIGGVASTVFYDDNPMVLNGAGGTVNRQGWAADLSMNESYEAAGIASEALYPMGCGMALRREALERVGPFDERMLNYYDDVDYGTRLWRAGFRVVVAPDAWIDHGFGAVGGDSARKRLWCERHRMRVVLKHAPRARLATWVAWEARGLRQAPWPIRGQKLRSWAWNARHLPSALANRWRLRRARRAPDRLIDDCWGDGFPAGVPLRLRPKPDRAQASIEMADPRVEHRLLHGWFPAERAGERSYRWAGTHAAALIRLDQPVVRLRIDYAHVPADTGGIDVCVRRLGSSDPLTPVWRTRLLWQYIARSVENHPLMLGPGAYEVLFVAAQGWSDPPRETRKLAFALSSVAFAESFEIAPGGLNMASPEVEEQLISGWFEAEQSSGRNYRWATGHAALLVRLTERTTSARIRYRFPPGPTGGVRLSVRDIASGRAIWSSRIPWREGEWHEESLSLPLSSGEYVIEFEAEATWSNRGQRNASLPPENRSLGFALASLSHR
jgi:GT2 family glycosyltransferase